MGKKTNDITGEGAEQDQIAFMCMLKFTLKSLQNKYIVANYGIRDREHQWQQDMAHDMLYDVFYKWRERLSYS